MDNQDAQVALALRIAEEAHRGQTRWDGKTPYVEHPKAVAEDVFMRGLGPGGQVVALLHDVLEDTSLTAEDLISKGIDKFDVSLVQILTKRPGERYLNYILRCRSNGWTRLVKMADLRHNLSNLKPGSLRDKYELAMHILAEEDQ